MPVSTTAKQTHEDKLNLKLSNMLKTAGLNAVWEREHHGNTRIDIEITTAQLRIAVECEKDGHNKEAEAVKDAASRLVPVPKVDIAVAVVYPKECATEEDLSLDTVLRYAIVTKAGAVKYGTNYGNHARAIQWASCPTGELADILKHLYRDTGDPDQIANDLKIRLNEAVESLSERQCRNLAKAVKLKYPASVKRAKLNAATKRALLVVASAALFHARLGDHLESMKPNGYTGEWPPQTLGECVGSDAGTRSALAKSWRLILELDYQPIFEAAVNILAKSSGTQFAGAVDSMAMWALDAADRVESLRHDLMGRIFHAVLDTAKQDGSFYTTTPAAVLLAGLAIRDRRDLSDNVLNMRVLDPACGTGTLLMSAGERIRDVLNQQVLVMPPEALAERVLHGVDINVTAAHMAATTIGMLSPSTKFERLGIWIADFGVVDGIPRAGSLEMYAPDGLLPYTEWISGPTRQVDTGTSAKHSWHGSANLLIMNPPFTRSNIRHDQLGKSDELKVKGREKTIFKRGASEITRDSSGSMFMVLAEHLLSESGTLAVVLPTVVANGPSNMGLRQFLAKRLHIDTIVVPHDPERFFMSENTSISEMLVIAKRVKPSDTKIINLEINPGTVADAQVLARQINEGTGGNYREVWWSRSRIEKGDWSATHFLSQYLVERFLDVADGTMFPVEKFGDVVEFVNFQDVYGVFTASDRPDRHARLALVYNSTKLQRYLQGVPDKYLIEKPGYEQEASKLWENGCLLHLQLSLQPNITRPTAVRTDGPSIGFTWRPTRPKPHITTSVDIWSKAMTAYLNCTVGVLALLGVKDSRKPLWPRYPVENLRSLSVPLLNRSQVARLARIYDQHKDDDLGILRNPNRTRESIDTKVCNALSIDKNVVRTVRIELSREPMVTGKRYGEQPNLDDFG